jgi:hypothetical protein
MTTTTAWLLASDRTSLAIFSIVLFPRWVTVCFLQGAGLPDPRGHLKGSGNVVRHIRLETLAVLDDPGVRSLIILALHRARVPLDPRNPRQLIIKSISAKHRPRKPAAQDK